MEALLISLLIVMVVCAVVCGLIGWRGGNPWKR